MVSESFAIRRFDATSEHDIQGSSDLLIDVVEGGASVGFMLPLTHARAQGCWRAACPSAALGDRIIVVADDSQSTIVGTVQVPLNQPENQPHRGDLAKMLALNRAAD